MSSRAQRGICCLALLLTATSAGAQTRLLIVSGLGGAPKYTQAFAQMSSELAQAARDKAGLPDSSIAWFGEEAATKSSWYRGTSTRENVERALTQYAQAPNGALVLVLIGHGNGEGKESRISLPGVDLTAADFERLLTPWRSRPVAFVNLTSASGDMLPVLAAPNRVVITATKTAFERNESRFGRYFVDAFAKDVADIDKDGRVSMQEAFQYASTETKRYYETDGKLATEHPQLADDGQLSRRFFLATAGSGGARVAGASGKLNALYAERDTLDQQIEKLKARKTSMTQDAYDQELERLLVALAEKTREIRQLERGS